MSVKTNLSEWTHTRITLETLNKILDCRRRLIRGDKRRRVKKLSLNHKGQISNDQIISLLCDHYLDHCDRSSKRTKTESDLQTS